MSTASPYPQPLADQPYFGPLSKHHRNFRSFPPTTLLGKAGVIVENAFESLLVHSSIIPDAPVYDSNTFPWVKSVEDDWKLVREELDQIMTYRDEIPSFHEIINEVSTITSDNNWKTFFLMSVGLNTLENGKRCPNTMKMLKKIPGITTAMFSILSPGKHIPPHRGPYAGVLRLHLGLLVPNPREKCRIRIGDQCYTWEEGKIIVFDDTYNHEVWNDTDGYRVVLFVDFQRPMTFPMDILNSTLMNMASFAPFIREAGTKQKAWEKRFYKKNPPPQ
jgi:aspartyl/asparaginyl beta-hydroxylase (cupin superfamily)